MNESDKKGANQYREIDSNDDTLIHRVRRELNITNMTSIDEI